MAVAVLLLAMVHTRNKDGEGKKKKSLQQSQILLVFNCLTSFKGDGLWWAVLVNLNFHSSWF